MFYTLGYKYYPGYILEMSITDGLAGLFCEEAAQYCKVIFIKSGASHFLMNGKEFILTGTYAVCMNELDTIKFFDVKSDSIKILWFKPTVINMKFTKEVMYDNKRMLSSTEFQDMFFIQQFTKEAELTSKIVSLHSLDSAEIDHRIQVLNELLAKQETGTWPCRSRSYLFEILFSIARQEADESFQGIILSEAGSQLAKNVVYYLQSCYDHNITIEKLAEQYHTNRTTLSNEFKNYTGQSVNQYLIEQRLSMASIMLRDTELSVDEICQRTGFHDISYFSKIFKKKLTYTPSEYRRITNRVTY